MLPWQPLRQYLESCGRYLQHLWQKWWLARCLDGLARLGVADNRHAYAVRLFGAADAMRGAGPPPPSDRQHIDRALAGARAVLGEQAFAAAWAEGRAMIVEQAVTHALDEDRPSETPSRRAKSL